MEKFINAGWVTTFNKYAIVSENRCNAIPEHIDNDEAALFGCAVTNGFGVIENNAKLKIGESVVVMGQEEWLKYYPSCKIILWLSNYCC